MGRLIPKPPNYLIKTNKYKNDLYIMYKENLIKTFKTK